MNRIPSVSSSSGSEGVFAFAAIDVGVNVLDFSFDARDHVHAKHELVRHLQFLRKWIQGGEVYKVLIKNSAIV